MPHRGIVLPPSIALFGNWINRTAALQIIHRWIDQHSLLVEISHSQLFLFLPIGFYLLTLFTLFFTNRLPFSPHRCSENPLSSSTLLPLQESFFVDGLWPGKPPLKYSLQRSIIYCGGMVGFVLCFSPHLVSSTAESEFTRNFSNCDGSVPHFWPLWITPPPEKCAMMHSVSRFRFRRFLVHGRRQCGLIICDHCPKEKGSKEVWRLHVSGLCCRCCPLVFHQYFLVSCGVVYYFVSSSATMVRRRDGWLVAIGGGTESEIRASSSSSSLRLVVRRAFGRLEFEIQMAVIWKFYRNSESELFSRMMT